MCGRFTLRAPASLIAEQFGLFEMPAFVARFNIAPTQPVPVIRQRGIERQPDSAAAGRELSWLRWGLIPAWSKDPAISGRLINARAESVAERPAFHAAIRSRRCLVVADGFYEWEHAGRAKRPFFFSLRDDRAFAFAGIWETWKRPDQPAIETCAILTTAANELVRPIHDRMPVILSPADYATWLDPAIEGSQQLTLLLAPYPADAMQAHPVGDFVNSPAHDSPQCVQRVLRKSNTPFPEWQ
jgi:putative SOS response-associated peptidase YedK